MAESPPKSKSGRPRRRWWLALRLSAGLALLLAAGFAVGLRGQRLAPQRTPRLLAEPELVADRQAAFRLVARSARQPAPHAVELTIERQRLQAVIARREGRRRSLSLQGRMPPWPPGPARLRARVETAAGIARLEAAVRLTAAPGAPRAAKARRLRLLPPAAAWRTPPAWRVTADRPGAPPPAVHLLVLPLGGWLSTSGASRVLIRVADDSGRPLAAGLRVAGRPAGRTGEDGCAVVQLGPRAAAEPVPLRLRTAAASVSGPLALRADNSPLDLEARPLLATAGGTVELQLRNGPAAARVHWDAWWQGGWCAAGQVKLERGRASVVVRVPEGIAGPLLFRAGLDPLAHEPLAMRRAAVYVAAAEPPSVSAALMGMTRLSTDGAFWAEARGLLRSGRSGLVGLLSRVAEPAQPLPRLAVTRVAATGAAAPATGSAYGRFALWLSGSSSALLWLVWAWLLRGAAGRRWPRIAVLVALAGALAAAWIGLWLRVG